MQKNISNIEENIKKEKNLSEIAKDHIKFINEINSLKTSSSKDFYIIFSNSENTIENSKEIIFEELNEKYFKIKECLSRCGNNVINLNSKKEIKQLIFSFLNSRIYFK